MRGAGLNHWTVEAHTEEAKVVTETPQAERSEPRAPEAAPRELPGRDALGGGAVCPLLGALLFHLYAVPSRHWRGLLLKLLDLLEHGQLYSLTLRRIFWTYHRIEVGLFSGGGCFVPGNLIAGPQGIKIGRYCSFSWAMHSFNANHPMNLISSHAIFYNPELGLVEQDIVPRTRLEIGNDVWVGYNAIILPTVQSIGDGAVIGAGAVVHQDVPPYAVVVGNPARVVRYRFGTETIQALLASRWWEKSPEELKPELDRFRRPLEGTEIR